MKVKRAKKNYATARAAWKDIHNRTKYRPADVVKPCHTRTHWCWEVRSKKRNPSFKTKGKVTGAGKRGVVAQRTRKRGVVTQRTRKRGIIPNPKRLHRGVRKAVELYSSFHGTQPKWVDEYVIEIAPVAMLVGKVAAIEYETPHNRTDRFRHEFTGRSRPTLAVTSDGRQLLLLGGQYYFNDHGIIDGVPN